MRSRRSRRRFERVIPKPEVVIEETPDQPPVAYEQLEPSRARERRTYEPSDEDNAAFRRVVTETLDALDVDYTVDFAHEDYQRAFIEVGDREAGALIGKRGAGIDSLELLFGRMASHQCRHAVPVQADVNEYRKRREEELREDALVRARRVLDTGEDEHLPSMNARERRVVHLAVQSLGDELTTYSVGHGAEKAVVIRRNDDD